MHLILLAVRLLLAGLFLVAGDSKLRGGLTNSRKSLADFGVPSWLVGPLGIVQLVVRQTKYVAHYQTRYGVPDPTRAALLPTSFARKGPLDESSDRNHAIAAYWSPDFQRKAEANQMTDDAALGQMLHVAFRQRHRTQSLEPARARAILVTLRDAGAVRVAEAVVKVQPISNRRLDGVSEWLLKHGFALNRRNWCELNWGFNKTDEEIQALVEGRGDGEELAEIPRYLSNEDDDSNSIPRRKAKIISIRT
jgi:hypothetical protein